MRSRSSCREVLPRGIARARSRRAGRRLPPRAKASFAFLCAAFAVGATAAPPASARPYLDRPSATSGRREQPPRTHLIASVRSGKSVAVYARPSGRLLARLSERTPFGSKRTFSVVRKRGRWMQVTDPSPGHNRLGWISVPPGRLRYTHTLLEIEIDLSRHTLMLRRNTHVLRRIPVDIGSAQSPTPTGRFAVTDKLDGSAYSPLYGCCILALSARQPHLPAWWRGGDRIAIHGTNSGQRSGAPTAGCVRAASSDLSYLMRKVPLGTPVVIHA